MVGGATKGSEMTIRGKLFPSQGAEEKVFLVLRRHWFTYLAFLIIAFIMALPLFIALSYMLTTPEVFSGAFGNAVILIGGAYSLFIAGLMLYGFVDYYLDVYIVTDERIVDIIQSGFFKIVISPVKDKWRPLGCVIVFRDITHEKEVEKIIHCEKKIEGEKKRLLSEEEYSVFSKNTDISEELTRISYHCRNFLATIKKPAACGKELDFISQEIQREANTISAKAQSAKISSSVVKIKSGIDRIREQVQNVE